MKRLSVNDSIYTLSLGNPDIIELMVKLGFSDITRPGMLHTAGRAVSLKKGARLRAIEMDHIRAVFLEAGYELIDEEADQ